MAASPPHAYINRRVRDWLKKIARKHDGVYANFQVQGNGWIASIDIIRASNGEVAGIPRLAFSDGRVIRNFNAFDHIPEGTI